MDADQLVQEDAQSFTVFYAWDEVLQGKTICPHHQCN